MRFLLVALNAKYIHSNPALYSLKRFAGENAVHVELAEYTINNRTEDILADIYKRKPDAVGFSCYIWNWSMVQDIMTELFKLYPDVPVWLGGPEVSFDATEILQKYPALTGVMVGEGEETFSELLDFYVSAERQTITAIEQGVPKAVCGAIPTGQQAKAATKQLSDIPGLVLRSGPTVSREPLSMDRIPFLYSNLEDFKNRIIYYESQRGCPFRCSYCLSSIEKSVRLRDIDVVKSELQFFLENQVSQVKFVDRTFNCNHAHAMAIWQYIKENDNGVTNFHFEIAGDILREDEIALLNSMRPGLVQLEIGVQSTNEKALKEIRRVMDISKLKEVVATIKSGDNIHCHLDLIAGLPYEDYESFANSFNEVYAMKPHQLQLGFLKVLKGSYMHEMAKNYGLVYHDKPPYEVLYTNWLSFEEICRLKRIEEMVELYFNSNQFTHTLPVLERAFASPFAFYEALADFYGERGCFTETPSRIYRYQVLLEFATIKDAENLNLYQELLTYDLYLRENVKSRPGFAGEITCYKQEMTEFYKAEETSRTYLPDYTEYDSKQMARMTHIEPFHYPVWKVGEAAKKKLPSVELVLFDYKNRSPLTYEARTVRIVPEKVD